MQDEPPYDLTPPEPRPPRVYRLSGDAPLGHGSVALAVLGSLLDEAEKEQESRRHVGRVKDWMDAALRVSVLREARDRVAEAGG